MKSLGKILDVNLTDSRITISDLREELVEKFFGGRGLSVWFLYENIAQGVNPLGPENVLILSCGFLTGTAAPSSSRLHVGSKSPLTGLLGSSNVGGGFGAMLRSCGFQSILIRGRARRPVYLWIHDERAEIVEANLLWGLDTSETDSRLKRDLRDDKVGIMTIGPGGENLVLFASIISDRDHAAGRTGMGAVMGSKHLKAIVVRGGKGNATSDPSALSSVQDYIQRIKNSPLYQRYSTYGIAGSVKPADKMGVLGTRNYRNVRFEGTDRISGEKLYEYVTRPKSCHRCPVHCKAEIKIPHGKFSGTEGVRPEFETIMALGSKCGLNDTEALIYLSNLCNHLGIDTNSTGSVIAFAMDLYDRGILSLEDTRGIDLTWGNSEAMEKLIHQIARREGLGAILSQGVRRAAIIIGKGSERFAYHVKGLELPGSDPRGLMGTALGYAVSTRGADFSNVYALPECRWSPEKAEAEFGIREVADRFSTEGKGVLVRRSMIVCAAIDCLGICKVPALSIIGDFDLKNEAALTKSLSGEEFGYEDLFQIGERVLNLERLFDLRHGATSADDRIPDKFVQEPIDEGPGEGKKVEGLEATVKGFYRAMGWDEEGVPSQEKLESLGLSNVHWDLSEKTKRVTNFQRRRSKNAHRWRTNQHQPKVNR